MSRFGKLLGAGVALALMSAGLLAAPTAALAKPAMHGGVAIPAAATCYKEDGGHYACYLKSTRVPPGRQCYDTGTISCYAPSTKTSAATIPASASCYRDGDAFLCGPPPPIPSPPPPPPPVPSQPPKS